MLSRWEFSRMLWLLWKACILGEAADRWLVCQALAEILPELIRNGEMRIAAIERRQAARKRNHA